MKIKKIEITNFRAIENLIIGCSKDLNVFAGINGAGKSSILDAVSIILSWLVNRIPNENGNGIQIQERDIRNTTPKCYIDIHMQYGNSCYRWYKIQTRKGKSKDVISDYSTANKLALYIRENSDKNGLPLIAYYPSNRTVLDIPLRIRKKHTFDIYECYDESLKGLNFRHFFEWFRNREDLENEHRKYVDSNNKPEDFEFPDRQLNAVRTALKDFLPNFSDFAVKRNPLHMVALKNKKEYSIEQLSDGEKNLIALVGDLARRLAIANPHSNNPLESNGIILIDEIDLHLHPSWQREVINKLTNTFPNCQFFISTHSPQVLGEVKPENIFLLDVAKDGNIVCSKPKQSYGLQSNSILNELMLSNGNNTLSRNNDVEKKLNTIFELIDDENFAEAKQAIEKLKDELNGSIPDLVRADSLIAMLEPEQQQSQK